MNRFFSGLVPGPPAARTVDKRFGSPPRRSRRLPFPVLFLARPNVTNTAGGRRWILDSAKDELDRSRLVLRSRRNVPLKGDDEGAM
jgi:hypothetical protein